MKRLALVLMLTIGVGGMPLWEAHAATSHSATNSPAVSANIFSGLASAIDRFVSSVIETFKTALGIRVATKVETQAPRRTPEPVSVPVTRPATEVVSLPASAPDPGSTPAPQTVPARVAPTSVPAKPSTDTAHVAASAPSRGEASETKMGSFSLFPTPRSAEGPATPTASTIPDRPISPPSTQKGTSSIAAQSVAQTPPLAIPATASTTPVELPATESRASPSELRVAPSGPVTFSLPLITLAPTRTAPAETRTVAVAPFVREPVVAVPRFIDTVLPTRPVDEPTAMSTRDAAPPTRPPEDARIASPVDEVPAAPAEETSATQGTRETKPTPALELSPGTTLLSDGTQRVLIQSNATSTTITDGATGGAVVCKASDDFPVISLGENETGVTRAVVLGGGVIVLKPTGFFKKFIEAEGDRPAADTPPKDCNLIASIGRLSTPDLVLNMPKMSETDRELTSAKTMAGGTGRVFIVVADHGTDKILRGIMAIELHETAANSKVLFKMFPERQQLPLVVRGMTVVGDPTGRVTADLVLTAGDGTTTTQHCEFSSETDMTCTIQGAL